MNQLREYMCDGTPQRIAERYARLPQLAREMDFGPFDGNVVVLDTETTGVSFKNDELTQIAAARMEKGEVVDWFVTFVNPGKPIPEEVVHLTHIHDEDVADAPTPQEALAALVEFVGDATVVAHNANFDRTFTTRHPEGYPLLENLWVDSLDLARISLPQMKSHRLVDLVKAFGAPVSTHRADDDVAATCALFRILLAAVSQMPPMLVVKIASLCPVEEWQTGAVFQYFASCGEQTPFSLRQLRKDALKGVDLTPKRNIKSIMEEGPVELQFPTEEEIAAAFAPNGLLSRIYPEFEPRSEQQQMAQAVRSAFDQGTNLVVEAGTGVGKSMAYLLSAAAVARDNNITVGVATKTNALLDQLVYKELPALTAAMKAVNPEAPEVTFAPLKGFSHYVCLWKLEQLVSDGARLVNVHNREVSQAPSMAALLSFAEQSDFDDMDTLKIDFQTTPRYSFTTASHDCLRHKCPYFNGKCFVFGARARAAASHVVVTNHSLFFCDLSHDHALLPPSAYWVVDEAHGAEAEARRALSSDLEVGPLRRIARHLASTERRRSLFDRIVKAAIPAGKEEASSLLYGLLEKAREASQLYSQAVDEYAKSLRGLLFFDESRRSKSYETVEIWLNDDILGSYTFKDVKEKGVALNEAVERLIMRSQDVVAYLDELDGCEGVQRELASVVLDLKCVVSTCEILFKTMSDRYVYSAFLNRKEDKGTDKLEAQLFNVGGYLDEALYPDLNSVVYTSATLTVDGTFQSFCDAMGLNTSPSSACQTLELPSSYDFDHRMTIYVVKDLPEPSAPAYLDQLATFLAQAHLAQGGAMLTLFTNRREMERCFETVAPALKEEDLRVVCQKWGVSVKGLRDDFVADEHLSLFALKSFWEGFDAPGATLKGVVIPKLPFSKPSDPLSCERANRDDNAWKRYVLPAAVTEVKQAAGRLIRRATDEGAVILADSRVASKWYGKVFQRSMPSRNIKVMTRAEILEELAAAAQARREGPGDGAA
ncbi:helicase C-terminal domain-containing protein [Parvibacter caecicola]|uniref:helicase C-terminal domain-containing protein n=1 Tax=Parvibacter caecicola TaxID=747645 RepID=UPI00249C8DD4|nr:helicase C-terminal domain-containing protein [Parvibacter caecicola]